VVQEDVVKRSGTKSLTEASRILLLSNALTIVGDDDRILS